MSDTKKSIRAPLARFKGLGAAGHGVGHFWQQRMTAVSNVALVLAFVVIVASLAWRPYEEVIVALSHPLIAVLLILGVASVTWHMRLGMQTVIEDYVHDGALRIVAVILNNFYAAAIAAACLYAVLKIGFGGIVLG